jgi:hypothetical protein
MWDKGAVGYVTVPSVLQHLLSCSKQHDLWTHNHGLELQQLEMCRELSFQNHNAQHPPTPPEVVPEYPRGDCGQTNDRSSRNKRSSKSPCFIHNSHGSFEFSGITHPSGSTTHVGHVTRGCYNAIKTNCRSHNFITGWSKDFTLRLYRRLDQISLPSPYRSRLLLVHSYVN